MRLQKTTWILIATILGSSMAFIDSSVVNVALPRIQFELNSTSAGVQWVVESYALFLGALILVGGSLGDQFGRKRIFAIGVGIFTLASLGCGISQSITMLIIARAIQGIGGALLTPGSLAIIRSAFDEQRRGRAIGLWSGFSSITSALGPVIGGWLVQNASWRWVFFINVPLAMIVLIVLFLHVPESRNEETTHLDLPGAVLATLGLGALVFGLIESETLGLFNPLVLGCVVGGILVLVLFVVVELRVHAPMMPLTLFRSRTFSGTNLLTLFLYAALGGTLFFLPFNLIQVHGYSATAAGASLLPFTLLMFSLSRWTGGLVAKYGARLPLIVGPLIAGAGFVLFALPGADGSYWTTYFPAVIVLGLGMSITVPPLTTTVMGAVADRYAGVASAINNAVARIAGLLAIAIFSIVLLQVFSGSLDSSLSALHLAPQVQQQIDVQRDKMAGIAIPGGVDAPTHARIGQAIEASFVAGFRTVMLIGAGLCLASALCTFVFVAGRPVVKEETETQRCGDNASSLTCIHQPASRTLAVTSDASASQRQPL